MLFKTQQSESLFWKIALIFLGLTALSTGLVKDSEFWTGYVLDITGPAWCYILIRGRYKENNTSFFGIRFSAWAAFLLILGVCFIVESLQYIELYESTFDPIDYPSYFSLIIVVFSIDIWLIQKRKNSTPNI